MAQHILVEASDVWGLFQKEKEELSGHERKIADNPEFGAVVCLSEEQGKPNIIAYLDDEEVYEELCVSESDCKMTVQKFYDEYLTEKVLNRYFGEEEEEDYTHLEEQTEIDERESELDDAVLYFLEIAMDMSGYTLDDFTDEADEIYEDVKDHFLEYLARKWGLPIRRPMYLEDEDGEEFFEEYPYDCMEFDDEDNPIYN